MSAEPNWWDLTNGPGITRRSPAGQPGWSADQRRWVKLKWERIRKSQQIADSSSREWNQLSDAINRYMDESGIVDIVQRARVKGESLPLAEAFERGKWHAAEAQRHIDDLQLFLRLKEMGLL